MSDHNKPELTCVGALGGAHGVRGDVRVKSFCAIPEEIETYSPLSTEDGGQSYSLTILRPTKGGFIARLSGVSTKEQADALRGVRLYVDRTRLPNLPDDEYYYADLIGLAVFDTGGVQLGTVKSVQNHGASDLLEIQSADLKDTALLPFTQAAVPTVDMASGRIIADPPDGIF